MSLIPDSLDEFDAAQHIIVICHHGMRSMNVAHYLENNGFDNITNLSGGIHSWAIDVDSSMEQY